MKSIGLRLQQAREDRGMSVEDVASVTRISRTIIEAIEADDRTALPAEVYVRGFTRTIATTVGLNPQDLWRTRTPERVVETTSDKQDRFAMLLGYGPRHEPTFGVTHVTMAIAALGMFVAAWLLVGQRSATDTMALDSNRDVPAIQEHVDAVTPFTAQDLRADARR